MERVRIAQVGRGHGHADGKWQALCSNPDVAAVDWDSQVEDLPAEVVAVAVESRNHESLALASAAVAQGKKVWLDKPAGEDFPAFERLLAEAEARGVYVQLGYMFRYSPGFAALAELVQTGRLGGLFALRAHMSTWIDLPERIAQSRHRGGILYDLGGHMIDQIVWLLGRPKRVSSVLRNDATPEVPGYVDNTLAVFEYDSALATVDIAAMEPRPMARRFEVYGSLGSAILEPFDPARIMRLVISDAGEQNIELPLVSRQALYERELVAFVGVLRRQQPPDRPAAHELLVQETLLRATGVLA
jgi:predicted dehydrogenase